MARSISNHECVRGPDGACVHLCTSQIGIFQSLSHQEQEELVRAAGHRHVPAGTVIFQEDDPADRILVVHRGRIKLNHYSAEGKEYVLDIVGPGGIYGDQRLFSGLRQEVNAVALEAASFCEIHKRDIEALIKKSPEVGIRMLEELGAKYSRVSRLHEILSINDAKGRVAGFLLHAGGEASARGLRIARDTISASINLRTETISRKLKELEAGGLVALEGHKVIRIICPEGLRDIFESSE
ncbi:MAG: Crp/Fnr family transcriptional regulator [Eubacteriales bacterium]|nr:Crp/Fnr family transcriptional regulator [Eubacteriales bacterium]